MLKISHIKFHSAKIPYYFDLSCVYLIFFNTFALDFYNRDIIVLNIITKRTNALKTRNVIAGKILVGLLLLAAVQTTKAQSGTNSPYSQFGLGQLSEQSSGFNRGMDGLALGFHEHNQINYLNPASYSALDSLSFIFDIGASGQVTNFKENGVKKNAKNADFEYIVAGFRVLPHFGLSFGFLPYTNGLFLFVIEHTEQLQFYDIH